jgi:large subunit ribosomal protein L18
MEAKIKQEKRNRRHKRVRAKIKGTAKCPRLCVFRSNKYTTAQLIDDEKAVTIVAVNDQKIDKSKIQNPNYSKSNPKSKIQNEDDGNKKEEKKEIERTGKVAKAYEVGKLIAEKALEKKIKKVVFDRGGYKYHGRTKAVAEGARDGGLEF